MFTFSQNLVDLLQKIPRHFVGSSWPVLYNNLDDLLALSVLCCLFLCDVIRYIKLLLDPKTLSLGALLSVQGDLEGLHGMAVVLAVKEKSNVSLV